MSQDPFSEAAESTRLTPAALDTLLPIVYDELRALAHRHLVARSGASQTVSTTVLVHEAYLKLSKQSGPWLDRTHFLAVAALAMRHVLVDFARRRRAQKRGAGLVPVELTEWCGSAAAAEQASLIVALDEALTQLSTVDGRLARVIELRFFGGLSVEETAAVLEVSSITVKRDTRAARAFLARALVV